MRKHMSLAELDKELNKDPEFVKIWEAGSARREITKAIMAERIKKKMTQEQLATKAGMKRANLTRVETGATSPSLKTLDRIARALDKKLDIRFIKI